MSKNVQVPFNFNYGQRGLSERYNTAAILWNPTKYDLHLKRSKERVCRFIARRHRARTEQVKVNDKLFKHSLAPYFTFWKIDGKSIEEHFELRVSPQQFKEPTLLVTLKNKGTKMARTLLTEDLFPFPHYLEPNGDYRNIQHIDKVTYTKAEWKIEVVGQFNGEEFRNTYYASPMQWPEGAWKQMFGKETACNIEKVESIDFSMYHKKAMMPVIIQNNTLSGDFGFKVTNTEIKTFAQRVITLDNASNAINVLVGQYFY